MGVGAAAELTGLVTDGVIAGGDVVTGAHLVDRGTDRFPVLPVLAEILPGGGLARGRTVACTGDAAVSAALALCARTSQSGSWLALVGVPWIGVEAARELGVSLERTVSVHVDRGEIGQWAERVAAAVDGFDLVLTRIPERAGDRVLRRIGQRLTSRGGVLIDVVPRVRAGHPRHADLVLGASARGWQGIDRGSGHVRSRWVTLEVSGRRAARAASVRCCLPAPGGALIGLVREIEPV